VSPATRTVAIEKLAPTGEGVARTADGVGFVDRALPGEFVETNVYEVRKRFWRGAVRSVRLPSPDRVGGPHADCAGCDWAHFAAGPALSAKRELFLETLRRIGRMNPSNVGEVSIGRVSPAGYRLRTRLHVEGVELGYFSPGSHRVVPADACEGIAEETRALFPQIRKVLEKSDANVRELAMLETVDGARRLARVTADGDAGQAAGLGEGLARLFDGVRVESGERRPLLTKGETSLPLEVGGRVFTISVDTFFQGNRYLVGDLYAAVAEDARLASPGEALDVFGGAGLFAAALLDAGHRATSVEGHEGAAADARATRESWADRDRLETVEAPASQFLADDDRRWACVVADPPRAGLDRELARELARRTESVFVYVSCDPATLARDLSAILAEGFRIRHTRLFDLFAFTHRVEAVVTLERAA
jgi:tRNA/tmRNA/rRNA uracil-C5-methylase (TrmA/RlmC/RlmD family)